MKIIRSNTPTILWKFVWISAALGLWCAGWLWICPAEWLPSCRFREWTGWPCPTCGATRCFQYLIRGDLVAAFWMQPALFLMGIAAASMSVYSGIAILLRRPFFTIQIECTSERWWIAGGVSLLLGINWIYLWMNQTQG